MRIIWAGALFAGVFAAACTGSNMSPSQPNSLDLPVRLQSEPRPGGTLTAAPGSGQSANDLHMGTHLTGAEEIPVRDTQAQGQATFHVNADGTAISYKLNVANIENVTQAHIHLAAAGANGGVVAWLYPSAPPQVLIPGRSQGTLGEGEITAASLVGSLAGRPLSALLDAMRSGGAYVNVHTLQFPPGEIRGQID